MLLPLATSEFIACETFRIHQSNCWIEMIMTRTLGKTSDFLRGHWLD
jgi:hypothetical protein